MLAHYTQIVKYFGQILGPHYEIILHVMDPDGGSHIGAIANGELSERNMDAPLTDFALQMVREKKYLTSPFISGYRGIMPNGREFKSSTMFITDDDNQLLGLLCVNFDIKAYEGIANQILSLAGSPNRVGATNELDLDYTERFAPNIEQLIRQTVPEHYLDPNIRLLPKQRLEIIKDLNHQNIFQIKGAVTEVANVLNISEPSVYRYLKQVNGE